MFCKSKIFLACFSIVALTAFGTGCDKKGADEGAEQVEAESELKAEGSEEAKDEAKDEGSDEEKAEAASDSEGFTSLGADAKLSELSAEDTATLCGDKQKYTDSQFTPSKEEMCKMSGIMAAMMGKPADDAAAQKGCQATFDKCTEADKDIEQAKKEAQAAECQNFKIPETCTATVAEYAACQKANLAMQIKQLDAMPACDKLTLKDFDALNPMNIEAPSECVAFAEKCPGLR